MDPIEFPRYAAPDGMVPVVDPDLDRIFAKPVTWLGMPVPVYRPDPESPLPPEEQAVESLPGKRYRTDVKRAADAQPPSHTRPAKKRRAPTVPGKRSGGSESAGHG